MGGVGLIAIFARHVNIVSYVNVSEAEFHPSGHFIPNFHRHFSPLSYDPFDNGQSTAPAAAFKFISMK